MNKLVAIINYNYFLIPTLNENNLSDFSITSCQVGEIKALWL